MARFAPDILVNNIFELTPDMLAGIGVCFLLIDLDNTMAPYDMDTPSRELGDWISELKNAGVEPFILSNNRGARPLVFARALGVDFAGRAGKPFTKVLRRTLSERNISPQCAALAGDQVFTDLICAKASGIKSVLVKPISLKKPLLALRYGLEIPFRIVFNFSKRG